MAELTCSAEHILKDPANPTQKPNWSREFPVIGGGTIIFNVLLSTPFVILIHSKAIPESPHEWISLEVGKNVAQFKAHIAGKTTILTEKRGKTKRGESVGYEEGRKISYWFSYDRNLLTLKYGKGYRMTETSIMVHDFLKDLTPKKAEQERKRLRNLFNPENKKIIEQYDVYGPEKLLHFYADKLTKGMTYGREGKQTLVFPLSTAASLSTEKAVSTKTHKILPSDETRFENQAQIIAKSLIEMEGKVDFDKNPFTCNWSLFVLDSSKNTLFELDSNNYTFSASLPAACQELYHNVVQEGVYLDWPPGLEKYKLSDAIRHSLKDPDGLLHKRLEEKAGEFGEHDEEKNLLAYDSGK